MPDIKWIRVTTDLFDDEKICLIEVMPEADTIVVIWVKLLCLAGKLNKGGTIVLSENIPYNEEELAAVLRRPLNTVRLAMKTFEKLHMIELLQDGTILLPNWEKHQFIEGMERIRMLATNRQRKHRQKEGPELLNITEAGIEQKQNKSSTILEQNFMESLQNVDDKAKELMIMSPNGVTSRDCHGVRGRGSINNKEEEEEDKKIWQTVLEEIKKVVSGPNYRTWFENLTLLAAQDGQVLIGAPTEYVRDFLENNQRSIVERVLGQVLGKQTAALFEVVQNEPKGS